MRVNQKKKDVFFAYANNFIVRLNFIGYM